MSQLDVKCKLKRSETDASGLWRHNSDSGIDSTSVVQQESDPGETVRFFIDADDQSDAQHCSGDVPFFNDFSATELLLWDRDQCTGFSHGLKRLKPDSDHVPNMNSYDPKSSPSLFLTANKTSFESVQSFWSDGDFSGVVFQEQLSTR